MRFKREGNKQFGPVDPHASMGEPVPTPDGLTDKMNAANDMVKILLHKAGISETALTQRMQNNGGNLDEAIQFVLSQSTRAVSSPPDAMQQQPQQYQQPQYQQPQYQQYQYQQPQQYPYQQPQQQVPQQVPQPQQQVPQQVPQQTHSGAQFMSIGIERGTRTSLPRVSHESRESKVNRGAGLGTKTSSILNRLRGR